MALIPITVDAGLEQNPDKAMVSDGAVTRGEDCEYLPDNPTPFKLNGRAKFNSSPEASTIRGAIALTPQLAASETGPPKIYVVQVGTKWRTVALGTTGSLADAVTGLTGSEVLAKAHLARQFAVCNGVDRPRLYGRDMFDNALFPSGHTDGWGFLGMLDTTVALTITQTATGLTLAAGENLYYWYEERVKDADGIIIKQSAPTLASVVKLAGPISDKKITLARPTLKNAETTHWAVFGTSETGAFPIGAELGEVAAATATFDDPRTGASPGFPDGDIYENVNITLFGVRMNVPLHGQPPIFDTADVFEDSLCTNDIEQPLQLKFSFAGSIRDFPATNSVLLGDGDNPGRLVLVRTVGQVLICCLENQVWVVFQLPHPDDKLFQISRVKQKLEGTHGCVGPLAGAVFPLNDREVLAYVSHEGILVTDGTAWDVLSDDLDWDNLIEPTRIDKTVLFYNPRKFRLEMKYTPVGGTENTRTMFFHTHHSHLKKTKFGLRAKVLGPANRGATSMFRALVNGRHELFTAEGTTLYREDFGNTNEEGQAISMVIEAGEKFLSGPGGSTRAIKAWAHHPASATKGQEATIYLVSRGEARDDQTISRQLDLTRRELTQVFSNLRGGSHILRFEHSDALGRVGLNFFLVKTEGDEEEKSPRRTK